MSLSLLNEAEIAIQIFGRALTFEINLPLRLRYGEKISKQ